MTRIDSTSMCSTTGSTRQRGRVLPDLSKREERLSTQQIQVFDPLKAQDCLRALESHDDEWSSEPASSIATEEIEWRRAIRKLADDPRRGMRDIFVCDEAAWLRVRALKETLPHMTSAIAVVERAARTSWLTRTRLRFPPLCLVGPPGCSKSYFARRCTEALGVNSVSVDISMTNERGKVTGYSRSWRGARIGILASAVIDNTSATTCFFLDEIEKSDPRERLADALLSVMEPENARRYCDEYISDAVPIKMDQALFILAANDASQIHPAVLDRALVIEVTAPKGNDRQVVITSIYRDAVEELRGHLDHQLDAQCLAYLERFSPRKLRQLFEIAIPIALSGGQRQLRAEDLYEAGSLLQSPPRSRIGFFAQNGHECRKRPRFD